MTYSNKNLDAQSTGVKLKFNNRQVFKLLCFLQDRVDLKSPHDWLSIELQAFDLVPVDCNPVIKLPSSFRGLPW